MAKLWQLDYGYKVKPLEGKNKNQEGYVTGTTEKGKIKINLDEKPYSGKHHIEEAPSNLEIIAISNPHKIFSTENLEKDKEKGYRIIKEKLYEFSPFVDAKFFLLVNDPQEILDNKKYFPERDGSDWIKLAKKIAEEYKRGVSKKEVKQGVKSLINRLNKEGKKP